MANAKLAVKNLRISFRTNNGAVQAVRDISFELHAGETLAVAGESGSGKSVTARALMGILAGNAMVEGGEIIYDGRDLLKIPEEEFHRLRGHRLAMVFQDPLSALNPIMRIGKQLTEAMVLNNKERRADGKKRFKELLTELEKNIQEAKKQGQSTSWQNVKEEIQTFASLAEEASKLENAYESARENLLSILDDIEEMDTAILSENARKIGELGRRMGQLGKEAQNPYLFPEGSESFTSLLSALERDTKGYKKAKEEALQETLSGLGALLQNVLLSDTPDFMAVAWMQKKGLDTLEKAEADLKASFLDDFLSDIELALCLSRNKSLEKKRQALTILEKAQEVFSAKPLSLSACKAMEKEASRAVEESIDPLALEKDNLAYVFASSLQDGLLRYQRALKENPREEKRFARDTQKYEEGTAKGKDMPSVVPLHVTDLSLVKESLTRTLSQMLEHYREEVGEESAEEKQGKESAETEGNNKEQKATTSKALYDYLVQAEKDASYELTKGMAKHKAIELMKEVGIPSPYARYHQYPFELSGGMRQRIVIAIALAANPDILICDEPTTALDVTIQAQILELINKLKKERNLSVLFITHDLGVVANMADRIAVMYAGKIVETGKSEEIFYDPKHPYTWALLASMPDLETKEKLDAIPGTPPNMILPPKGDAFAARNKYALAIDLEMQPPMFKVTDTHYAATWLLHPGAPKAEPPAIVLERMHRMQQAVKEGGDKA